VKKSGKSVAGVNQKYFLGWH